MATKTEVTDRVQHANLAAALAAVQTEIPSVAKGNTAQVASQKGSYSYRYADLAEITPLILPLLGKNGLAFSAQPTIVGDAFVLHYTLAHESSEAIEGIYPLPDPTHARPQEIGSAITYARRYALCAVTGVAPGGDDDDAASANERPAAARKPRQSKPAEPVQRPIETPIYASRNWAADIMDARTVEDLRGVYEAAEKAGEVGRQFDPEYQRFLDEVVSMHELQAPPAGVSVGQMLGAVRKAIEARPKAAESEPRPESADPVPSDDTPMWETATIPNGDES